jgi:hypothetical protein
MLDLKRVGLCVRCAHSRVTANRRGSQFYLCGLAMTDPRLRKYPSLPVLRCEGFELDEQSNDQGRENESHE